MKEQTRGPTARQLIEAGGHKFVIDEKGDPVGVAFHPNLQNTMENGTFSNTVVGNEVVHMLKLHSKDLANVKKMIVLSMANRKADSNR